MVILRRILSITIIILALIEFYQAIEWIITFNQEQLCFVAYTLLDFLILATVLVYTCTHIILNKFIPNSNQFLIYAGLSFIYIGYEIAIIQAELFYSWNIMICLVAAFGSLITDDEKWFPLNKSDNNTKEDN